MYHIWLETICLVFTLSVEMGMKFNLKCQQNPLALTLYTLPLPMKYAIGKILASSKTTFWKLTADCQPRSLHLRHPNTINVYANFFIWDFPSVLPPLRLNCTISIHGLVLILFIKFFFYYFIIWSRWDIFTNKKYLR